jgi:hypothetical protein
VHEVAGELALGLVEELGEVGGFGTLAPVDAAVLLTRSRDGLDAAEDGAVICLLHLLEHELEGLGPHQRGRGDLALVHLACPVLEVVHAATSRVVGQIEVIVDAPLAHDLEIIGANHQRLHSLGARVQPQHQSRVTSLVFHPLKLCSPIF